MDEVMIKTRNLYKSFGENHVLRGVDLTLHKGENTVILGRSGNGKSVLTKCIVGLLKHDKGSIELFDKDISALDDIELDQIRKKIGYLFQGGALYDSMSVRENLEFPIKRSRFERDGAKDMGERIHRVLESVGLEHTIDNMPSELSGGMKKRLGLARTLVLEPEIILYDEPTTGLDPVTAREISELMIEIQDKYKTSSIIITHDMKCAKITSNNVKVLQDGNFYAEGTYEELERSKDEVVNAFFK